MSEKEAKNQNQRYRYVRKEGIGLGLFNNTQGKGAGLGKLGNQGAEGLGIRAQIDPMIENFGNRIENRFLRVRTRMQTLGIGNMQPQQPQEPKKEVFYCPECNAEVTETQKFCPNCSAALTVEAKKEKRRKESLRLMRTMSIESV